MCQKSSSAFFSAFWGVVRFFFMNIFLVFYQFHYFQNIISFIFQSYDVETYSPWDNNITKEIQVKHQTGGNEMKNLKLMTKEEASKTNGGGAIGCSIRLFFKILFKPTKVY